MSGGVLDARAYAMLANAHRPSDREGQRLAARELLRTGLRELDIAHALGISIEAVRTLLRPTDTAQETPSPAPNPESREPPLRPDVRVHAPHARLAGCARGLRDAGSTPAHIARVLRISQAEVLELLSDDGTTEEQQ